MNKLWIRFSLIISGFVLVLILLPAGTLLILEQLNITNIQDDEPEEDGFGAQDIPETLLGITVVVGMVGIGLGVWLSRGLSAPIVKLATAAQQIGAGDLSQRVSPPTHSQELSDLAHAFNNMAVELQHAETLRHNLLADVSHELRTPLTALSGQLRGALDGVYALDEAEIAALYGQTQHLIWLVEDLHLLAQAEAQKLPLNRANVNVTNLLQDVSANFALLADEQAIIFVPTIPEGLPTLYADPVRLRQIVSNLLSNALRHTPAGQHIHLTATHTATTLTLTITDSGEGIAPQHLPHLFDRFYRTDSSRTRATGGTGLGLAIVKALVEEHAGEIMVASPGRGQGTQFTLNFPLKR